MSDSGFSISALPYPLNISKLKIGIAVAQWNGDITSILEEGAIHTLTEAGIAPENILVSKVPGTFELPLACQWLSETGCDATLALGCVVRGETPHFDYVCKAATDGVLRVGLDQNKPCIFGVLTTDTYEQATDRCGGKHGHKGREASETALWMLALKNDLRK